MAIQAGDRMGVGRCYQRRRSGVRGESYDGSGPLLSAQRRTLGILRRPVRPFAVKKEQRNTVYCSQPRFRAMRWDGREVSHSCSRRGFESAIFRDVHNGKVSFPTPRVPGGRHNLGLAAGTKLGGKYSFDGKLKIDFHRTIGSIKVCPAHPLNSGGSSHQNCFQNLSATRTDGPFGGVVLHCVVLPPSDRFWQESELLCRTPVLCMYTKHHISTRRS